MPTTIIVRWEGPHTLQDVSESRLGRGLYFLTGRRRYEREDKLQYFGITKNSFRGRINHRHHAVQKIQRNLRVWLGHLEYPDEFDREYLEIAEGAMIYFWEPELINVKKRYRPPEPVCLVARWCKPNGEPRLKRLSIYADLPDVLWWDGEAWRVGNLRMK